MSLFRHNTCNYDTAAIGVLKHFRHTVERDLAVSKPLLLQPISVSMNPERANVAEEKIEVDEDEAVGQPSRDARIRITKGQQGVAALDVGGATAEEITQLLDYDRQS